MSTKTIMEKYHGFIEYDLIKGKDEIISTETTIQATESI